jgi:hypothetical protein
VHRCGNRKPIMFGESDTGLGIAFVSWLLVLLRCYHRDAKSPILAGGVFRGQVIPTSTIQSAGPRVVKTALRGVDGRWLAVPFLRAFRKKYTRRLELFGVEYGPVMYRNNELRGLCREGH